MSNKMINNFFLNNQIADLTSPNPSPYYLIFQWDNDLTVCCYVVSLFNVKYFNKEKHLSINLKTELLNVTETQRSAYVGTTSFITKHFILLMERSKTTETDKERRKVIHQ